MHRRHSAFWIGALLAVASASQAASIAEVSVDAGASFEPACSHLATGATSQSEGCLIDVFARKASSQAYAGPGVLRADAFAGADAPNLNLGAAFATSRASASFTDQVTFFGPANSQVTVHAQLHLSGSVSSDTFGSTVSGIAEANYTVSGGLFGANFGVTGSYDDMADGTSIIVNPSPNQLLPLSFVVTFDSTGRSSTGVLQMSVVVDAFANAFGTSDATTGVFLPGHSNASANFANTVLWAGVTSVVDAQGNPVAGVSVVSDSGFDYMNAALPIPEPSVAALLLAAAACPTLRRAARRNLA